MSELIVVGFDDEFKAEQVRLNLLKMQQTHLIDLEDAVVVVKNKEGKLKISQAYDLVGGGAVSGGFWGLLVGALLFNPLLGAATGVAAGALSGALTDIGIDDNFIKELGNTISPSTSALFVLVKKATPDKVLDEIKKQQIEGTIIKTSLSYDDEAKLQAALKGE